MDTSLNPKESKVDIPKCAAVTFTQQRREKYAGATVLYVTPWHKELKRSIKRAPASRDFDAEFGIPAWKAHFRHPPAFKAGIVSAFQVAREEVEVVQPVNI